MHTIVKHVCDICRSHYDSEAEALECESRGAAVIPPDGVIFGDAGDPEGFYAGITFATMGMGDVKGDHSVPCLLWATRDTGVGDTLGDERCSGSNWTGRTGSEDAPDPTHPTFERMVRALKKAGIEPQVWDGTKIVSLDQFLSSDIVAQRKARLKKRGGRPVRGQR